MKTIEFEIHTIKNCPIDIPIKITRKYPVQSHNLFEFKKTRLKYKYYSTNSINEKEYSDYLIKYLTEKYTSLSTTCHVEIIKPKK